jgi:hypothetical protein
MVDASDEQRARNEVLFREVNERIEEVGEGLDGRSHSVMIFVCECGRTDCLEKIELTWPQYEALRANPKHFAYGGRFAFLFYDPIPLVLLDNPLDIVADMLFLGSNEEVSRRGPPLRMRHVGASGFLTSGPRLVLTQA